MCDTTTTSISRYYRSCFIDISSRTVTMSRNLKSTRLALIVIDMQNYFASTGKIILTELNATIASARQANIPVFFTQHGHKDPIAEEQTSVLVQWWGASGSIHKGSHNWRLLPNLDVASSDIIIDDKSTYDAFFRTQLKSLLDERYVDTVIIGGVMTQLCCETTARSAFVQNYNVLFLSDGTGPPCQSTLDTISFGFGNVLTCAEMRALFDKIRTGNSQ